MSKELASPEKAWDALLQTKLPQNDIKKPSIQSIEQRLRNTFFHDNYFEVLMWLLLTNEEYYYQNTVHLTTNKLYSKTNANKLLSISRKPLKWLDRLVNFTCLAKGNFGQVYRATDIYTDEFVIAKCYKPEFKPHEIFDYLKDNSNQFFERDMLLKSNMSEFIIKLLGTYLDRATRTYWFFMDYCIGNFQQYVELFHKPKIEMTEIIFNTKEMFKIWDNINLSNHVDIEEIYMILIFELMCALSYLAERRIVHRDIKPQNILISIKGHIKLANLSFSERTRWINHDTSLVFLSPSKKSKRILTYFIDTQFHGSIEYCEPELYRKATDLKLNEERVIKLIKSEHLPIEFGEQDFLYDLFSTGICCLDLLLQGYNPYNRIDLFKNDMLKPYDLNINTELMRKLWPIRIIYKDSIRERFLYKFLNNIITVRNKDIIEFIKSILMPKPLRAQGYIKTIEMYKLKDKVRRNCIDINKIENLDYYANRHITSYNVISYPIPESLLRIFNRDELTKKRVCRGSFRRFLNYLKSDIPGMSLESFNLISDVFDF